MSDLAHEYILSLDADKNISISDLQALIGKDFKIKGMEWSWSKEALNLDRLVITNIKFSVNASPELEVSAISVYADFYMCNVLKYSAWESIESVQRQILALNDN